MKSKSKMSKTSRKSSRKPVAMKLEVPSKPEAVAGKLSSKPCKATREAVAKLVDAQIKPVPMKRDELARWVDSQIASGILTDKGAEDIRRYFAKKGDFGLTYTEARDAILNVAAALKKNDGVFEKVKFLIDRHSTRVNPPPRRVSKSLQVFNSAAEAVQAFASEGDGYVEDAEKSVQHIIHMVESDTLKRDALANSIINIIVEAVRNEIQTRLGIKDRYVNVDDEFHQPTIDGDNPTREELDWATTPKPDDFTGEVRPGFWSVFTPLNFSKIRKAVAKNKALLKAREKKSKRLSKMFTVGSNVEDPKEA